MDQFPNLLTHIEVKQFYDETYYCGAVRSAKIPRHFRWLASKIGVRTNQRVLDVACGTGQWLLAVQARGAQPTGVDLSTTATAICRTIMPNGEFHACPAEALPFQAGQFDVVSCLGALEHFLDPHAALNEMIRVANDEAPFLLLVPNAGFWMRRVSLYQGTTQAAVHEDVRTLREWQELFDLSGLHVIQRWRDLHVLSWAWITARKWYWIPFRAIQAALLTILPLDWQYQVYHLCRKRGH